MSRYSLVHLSDTTLLCDLAALVAKDRTTTAHLLAHLAEVDARQLYLPAAYPSMYAYCVGELHLSEDAAFKRIQAARVARRFPAIFGAVAEGRLHLSAVVLLAPHLTEHTADELLAAAVHQSKGEIEQLLVQRFPRPELPTRIEALAPPPLPPNSDNQLAPGQVDWPPATRPVPGQSRVTPLAPESFAVQFTMGQGAHDKLRYAQALLGHQIPSGDIAALFERALDALIRQLEKRKFAATQVPRAAQPRGGGLWHAHPQSTANPRYIPAHVKRTVWERDQGQCTFVSQTGRRCPSRTRLEFDHVQEVARGGEASVAGIRLRCRAHNQYGAERTFGAEFMRHKRRAAVEMRTAAKAHATARAPERAAAAERARELDVVPWLRQLGFNAGEARRAAALCEDIPDASLEERVRRALSCFPTKGRTIRPVEASETVTRGHESRVQQPAGLGWAVAAPA